MLAACAAIPVGAMAILVYRAGFFRDFWFWNYTFNRYFYLKTHFTGPSAWAVTGVAVAENPLLWLAGFAGLAIALRRRLRVEPEIAIATLVVCGLLASLFQSRWPFSHNLLLLQPCLALLAVGPLERAVEAPRTRTAVLVVLTLLTVKVGVMSLVYTEGGRSAEVQQRLLAVTGPGDPLAVTPPYHPIFRRDAFFFWYVPQYNVVAYLACCREVGCPQGKVGRDLRAWVTELGAVWLRRAPIRVPAGTRRCPVEAPHSKRAGRRSALRHGVPPGGVDAGSMDALLAEAPRAAITMVLPRRARLATLTAGRAAAQRAPATIQLAAKPLPPRRCVSVS